jgi:hypothetical protein
MTQILDEINPQNRWARTIWFDFMDLERGYIANKFSQIVLNWWNMKNIRICLIIVFITAYLSNLHKYKE